MICFDVLAQPEVFWLSVSGSFYVVGEDETIVLRPNDHLPSPGPPFDPVIERMNDNQPLMRLR